MRWSTATCFALSALVGTLVAPTPAAAAPSSTAAAPTAAAPTTAAPTAAAQPQLRHRRDRVRAFEVQGLAMTQLLPRAGFGGDLAFVFGHPNFQARVGAMVVGVPSIHLGEGSLGNVLHTGTLDLCAAKQVLTHQVRMCIGGQAGGMSHRWKGYDRPGNPISVWAAGTLKGDYQVKLTKHFGVIGGVGMVIPVAGPVLQVLDKHGSSSSLVFPGPIAGFLSLGTTFRW